MLTFNNCKYILKEESADFPLKESSLKDFTQEIVKRIICNENPNILKLRITNNIECWDHFDHNSFIDVIIPSIAVDKVINNFSKVYEMPWLEVLVVYNEYSYDGDTEIKSFLNRDQYMEAVSFPKHAVGNGLASGIIDYWLGGPRSRYARRQDKDSCPPQWDHGY